MYALRRSFASKTNPFLSSVAIRQQQKVMASVSPLSISPCAVQSFSSTPSSPVNKIGIVGGGQMGYGIALVAATKAKVDVKIMDVNQAQLDNSHAKAKKILQRDVQKGRLTEEEMEQAYGRLSHTTSLSDLSDVDFVIEAATEDVTLKRKIFAELDQITKPNVILATNTSSISITKIAQAVSSKPDKVIGMHFMNPVPVMKLVEVISGLETSEETLQTTLTLAHAMGKTTSRSKDVPGFIANRLLMPYINEAVFTLQDGVGTREDIDVTMKLGTNMPMGPLALADFIGLDTCLAIMKILHTGFGDSKYRPCPLLQQYVDAGLLGVKTGRGFYDYSNATKPSQSKL